MWITPPSPNAAHCLSTAIPDHHPVNQAAILRDLTAAAYATRRTHLPSVPISRCYNQANGRSDGRSEAISIGFPVGAPAAAYADQQLDGTHVHASHSRLESARGLASNQVAAPPAAVAIMPHSMTSFKPIILHLGDPIEYNHDIYARLRSQFHIINPPLNERHRAAFVRNLRDRKWGDFQAIMRPFWNTGGEMGRWDRELIDLLPKSVQVSASAGAGFDWVDTDTLAESGELIKRWVFAPARRTAMSLASSKRRMKQSTRQF